MNPALIVDLSLFSCATLFFVAGFALARSLRLRRFEQRAVRDQGEEDQRLSASSATPDPQSDLEPLKAQLSQAEARAKQAEDDRERVSIKLLQVTRELDLFRDIQDQMSHLSGEKQDSQVHRQAQLEEI